MSAVAMRPGARKRWTRGRVARWLVGIAVLIALSPFALFIGFGLWRGLDVGAGLVALFSHPRGTTIDAAKVPFVQPRTVEWLGNLHELDLGEASGMARQPGPARQPRHSNCCEIPADAPSPPLFPLPPRSRSAHSNFLSADLRRTFGQNASDALFALIVSGLAPMPRVV